MGLMLSAIVAILRKPTIWSSMSELLLFVSPLWVAVLVGLVVGWAWKPSWAAGKLPTLNFRKAERVSSRNVQFDRSSSAIGVQESSVTTDDFVQLYRLVEETDGGLAWLQMMEKSLPSMSYKAWRRDSESGPPQYRSRTIFEDATPEVVRDFFWDDEFRMKNKWDGMLIYHNTLEEFPTTGTMIVRWIRKFPFFCSDREYIIGRRIWQSGGAYYCVTKGIPCSSIPRHNKPRRVDLYYSSWCIRAVESKRGDGQMTACEVLLFHYEDMGIPWEIAKLGVRQGMWGCVKRIEPGLRAYQTARISGEPLSPSTSMAHRNTKIGIEFNQLLEANGDHRSDTVGAEEKPWGRNIPKFLLLGGAVALACTLDQGLLTKAVVFGVARRFVRHRKQ